MSRTFVLLLATLAASSAFAKPAPGYMRPAVDVNPDPAILEVDFTVKQSVVDVTGSGTKAKAYTYNGTVPGPEIRAKVGDTIIVHVTNELPEPTLIHWHGIELDNANDGTTVTQDQILPGAKFTYRFRVPRPGIFWYHPHAMPTNQLAKGLYGALIVEDPDDPTLVGLGVLPPAASTWTLQLSDMTVCKAPGQNDAATFAPGADVPWAFTEAYGPFPGMNRYPTPRDLCEHPLDDHGMPTNDGPLAAGDVPKVQPSATCLPPKTSCRANEGQLVLANGRVATPRAGTPEKPGKLGKDAKVITARNGEGVRLQVLNSAGARYFRLKLTDQHGKAIPLVRVGGQGGLLDHARLEGGKQGPRDMKFSEGELMLAIAERADVVFTAQGKPGDVMTLWTLDFQHYGTADYPFGYAPVPTVPVAHIRIERGGAKAAYRLVAGDPLRLHPAVNHPTPSIRKEPVVALVDPAKLSPPRPGLKEAQLLLAVVGRETIDGVNGMPLEGQMDGKGDYRAIPNIEASRYAHVGDTIEFTVRNGTQMHHPWHLHGFSFQPVRLEDTLGNLVYTYDYNEFVDTWDIPATYRLVFRAHLEDRGAVAGPATGGAVGRWMMHCHIFHHNGVGMMTELVVLPRGQGADPVADTSATH